MYFGGPQAEYPAFSAEIKPPDANIGNIEDFVRKKYRAIPNLKPENAGYIRWADSTRRRTEYSILYLHGFSASPMEGDPVHREFAKKFGCNLYAPLLAKHGIEDKESFKDLTPKDLIDSAKEAIAVAQILGEKVIILSCSTGSTLSVYLTAHNPDAVHAQLLFSPNIDLADRTTDLLTKPWGLQIAQKVTGSAYRHVPLPAPCHPYWTMDYRLEGVVALKALVQQTMTAEVFAKITQPLFVGYYYKNNEESDHTVSVPAIREFVKQVNTPAHLKKEKAYLNGTHVMLSPLQNPDITEAREDCYRFAEEVLRMVPQH